MDFLIYVAATGEIVRTGACPADLVGSQHLNVGEALIEGVGHPATHRVVNEAITTLSSEAVAKRLNPPLYPHEWDWDTLDWVDLRTLDDLKDDKWAEIKVARDEVDFGTFTWDGSVFDADLTSQLRIQGAVLLAQLALANEEPFGIGWTLANNSVRTLTATEMIQVGVALSLHVNAVHEISRDLRSDIYNANSSETVDEILWPT